MKKQLFAVLGLTLLAAFKSQIFTAAFTSDVRAISRTANKALVLLFSVAVLLAGGAAAVGGQSALDGFNPHANDRIYVAVVQDDGKILIGGSFTAVLGVARNNIARLHTDGTLDAAFNPNATGAVRSIAVQADGQILAGGLKKTHQL